MSIRRVGITLTDLPIICWDNLVTASNVFAESDPDFPVSNVANPSTALKWKHDAVGSPVSAVEYLTIDVSQGRVNYVAIAGHNFATAGVAVGLEIQSWNSPIGSAESLFEPQVPDDDGPIIFLFQGANVGGDSPEISEVEGINIIFVPTATPAEAAVIYAGEYLQLEDGIQADHTPLPLARVSDVISGKSENGAFLGRVTISEGLVSNATIANMRKDFVREQLVPFLEFASESPFFWIWSPLSNPTELAFAWLENDPQPSFDIDGYVSIDLAMRGLGS
jgi:hypothetical protein